VSFDPTPEDVADRYGDARTRVVGLVSALSDAQLAVVVPGTPRWTVRDLVSHLVGGPICFLTGSTVDDVGSEEWTQAQVDARRDRSISALVEEWDGAFEDIDTGIRGGTMPVPVAFDLITHEQDLRGALGAEPTPDPLAVRFVTDGFGARVERVVERAGLPPLEIRDPTRGWRVGTPGGVSAVASEFEWFRALTGRRSGRQVSAFDWTGDPAIYLDLLCPFGPLRTTDVRD
jgi:uncharacterized protein (TIGR03083 family)